MAETCVVCNILNSQMMRICQHPKDLGFKLEFVLGYQAKENDFLCYTCYEELIIAFNFKQKCLQSKLNRPEFSTLSEDQSLSLLKVKFESNFASEDSSSILTAFPDDNYDDDVDDYSRKYFKKEKSFDIISSADEAEDTKNIDQIEEPATTSKVSKKQSLQQKLCRTR